MASAWVEKRPTRKSGVRHVVRYRNGGRESALRFGGSFKTLREANIRLAIIKGEHAALRRPDIRELERPTTARTLRVAAEAWRDSRLDVADGTAATHRVNLGRILPTLGAKPVDALTVADVAALVGALHEGGLARESIRKTRATLAMVLDFAGVQPNPARDRSVKLPREDRTEIAPPTADHIAAVLAAVPRQYRLPMLALDATGMRVGELDALTWGDVDEYERRWRVSGSVAKTGQARWVSGARRRPRRRRGAPGARRSRPLGEPVRRLNRRSVADGDLEGVQGDRDAAVQPARSPASARDALAPRRRSGVAGGGVARPFGAGAPTHVRARNA